MNEYLFTMANLIITCDQGSFDVDDTDYSCLYTIYRDRDGERPVIDMRSFKYAQWRNRKVEWSSCPAPPPHVVMLLEDKIQRQLDEDARTVAANQLAVAEGWQ